MTHATTPPASGPLLGTLALVLGAIVALFAVDVVLARVDRAAREREARGLVAHGRALAEAGRAADAAARFRAAVAIDRLNPTFRLELARAELAAGHAEAAESTLAGLLREHGTDGPANLAMARALVRQQRIDEATAYYHRAIYGTWPEERLQHRTAVRLELVDLLAASGARQELLAELLPLEAAGTADTQMQRRLAHLFLQAGSPSRAATLFRGLLADDGRSADAYAGLGEAEFALGGYRAAASAFRSALRLDPADTAVATRLQLVDRVRDLDPMLRGIRRGERERRASELLRGAVESAERCRGGAMPDSLQVAADSVAAESRSRRAPADVDPLDDALALAERVWRWRGDACQGPLTMDDEAIVLVLERLRD